MLFSKDAIDLFIVLVWLCLEAQLGPRLLHLVQIGGTELSP